MNIHFLNCFTCNARLPSDLRSGALCLLIETREGLVLMDTGLGQDDYLHRSGILRLFQLITIVPSIRKRLPRGRSPAWATRWKMCATSS